MSTRDSPGGKGGRCVRLTTYHPCSAKCQEIQGLNLPGPPWAISTACCGTDLYLYLYQLCQFHTCIPPGLLSPWTTVLLEKLTHPQSGIKFPTLHVISLACSQELHTSPYPEPDISCPCPPIPYFVTPILIISSYLCLGHAVAG